MSDKVLFNSSLLDVIGKGDIVEVVPIHGIEHLLKTMFTDDWEKDWAKKVEYMVKRFPLFQVREVDYDPKDCFKSKLSFELSPPRDLEGVESWWYPNYSIRLWKGMEEYNDP